MTRYYGWKPEPPDHRDRIYNDRAEILSDEAAPGVVDLTSQMPPVYDQGQLGSCTANGWAAVVEYREMRQNEAAVTPSRLFIYYHERLIENTVFQDDGAQVRTGARVVSTIGAPPESDWPYDISKFTAVPPAIAETDAAKHKALSYERIVLGTPGAPMRTALSKGLPIVFGFSVPDYFETNNGWSFSQPLPLPGPSTQIVGGHCTVVCGYDFTCTKFKNPAFKVRNSWGPDWGLSGHFWMDYRYFGAGPQALASDLWVVTEVS